MTYFNAYLLMYILHLQRLLQNNNHSAAQAEMTVPYSASNSNVLRYRAVNLNLWVNLSGKPSFFFLLLRFGHETGWVNAYPQSAWHEQYLHSDPQPPRVPVKQSLQHVAALFADCEIYSNGISELIPRFWRKVLMQNMQWIKFVLISFAAAINAVFLYSIRFFI